MTADEISKYASEGNMPEGLNGIERGLFFELRDSYAKYRAKEITRSQGEKIKADAVKRFNEENKEWKYAHKMARFYARLWKEIEIAGSEYRKNPTIEHADAFVEAVYGVGRKEMISDG